MDLRKGDIRTTLFGSVLRCHTTLTALLILLEAPVLFSDPSARILPAVLLSNWTFFALGKVAWTIRRRLFTGKTGPWFAMLGTLGGAAMLLALIFLFTIIVTRTAGRELHEIFGCMTVAPFLSYALHMLQENWKWVRWLVPLALPLPLCCGG